MIIKKKHLIRKGYHGKPFLFDLGKNIPRWLTLSMMWKINLDPYMKKKHFSKAIHLFLFL